MKRIICVIITITILAGMSTVAFASDSGRINLSSLPVINGVLESEGERISVLGVPVAFNSVERLAGMRDLSVTYRYDIPLLVSSGGASTVYDQDPGLASTVYLTINYVTRTNVVTEYCMTNISGSWNITDRKASVEAAYLTYGYSGNSESPSGYCANVVEDLYIASSPFSINTGFTDYIVSEGGSVMGANLNVHYLMGNSRRWNFTLSNYIFNGGITYSISE